MTDEIKAPAETKPDPPKAPTAAQKAWEHLKRNWTRYGSVAAAAIALGVVRWNCGTDEDGKMRLDAEVDVSAGARLFGLTMGAEAEVEAVIPAAADEPTPCPHDHEAVTPPAVAPAPPVQPQTVIIREIVQQPAPPPAPLELLDLLEYVEYIDDDDTADDDTEE